MTYAAYYEFSYVNTNLMCSGIFLCLQSLFLIDDLLVIQQFLFFSHCVTDVFPNILLRE